MTGSMTSIDLLANCIMQMYAIRRVWVIKKWGKKQNLFQTEGMVEADKRPEGEGVVLEMMDRCIES